MPDRSTSFQDTPLTQAQHRQIARLLLRLGSRENAERWTAQTELRKMAALPVPVLLAHMARLERVRRQSPFLLFVGIFASCFLLPGLLLVFDAIYGHISRIPVLLAVSITLLWMLRRWVRMRGAATRALANYHDMRQVGPLAQYLAEARGARETRPVARRLLLHLLPRMRRPDALTLTSEQRNSILLLLETSDPELVIALLRAIAQFGDAAAEQRVRELEQRVSSTGFRESGDDAAEETQERMANEQVWEAARDCLQALGVSRIQQRLQHSLLRVVNPNTTQTGASGPAGNSTEPQDTSTQGDIQ